MRSDSRSPTHSREQDLSAFWHNPTSRCADPHGSGMHHVRVIVNRPGPLRRSSAHASARLPPSVPCVRFGCELEGIVADDHDFWFLICVWLTGTQVLKEHKKAHGSTSGAHGESNNYVATLSTKSGRRGYGGSWWLEMLRRTPFLRRSFDSHPACVKETSRSPILCPWHRLTRGRSTP